MTAIDEFIRNIDYLYIERKNKEKYLKLSKSIIFREMGYPEIFLLALVLGIKHGKRKKISRSSNLFRARELRDKSWIILSVGYSELKDISVFETKESERRAFRVCEEYANSGIDILMDLMKKKPSEFILNLIEELLKAK